MSISSSSKTIKIFFSYAISSTQDKILFDGLRAHLSSLKRQGLIDIWYDSAISAGNNVTQIIEAYLNTADIIVLLISDDFFASERCYELEMKRALELGEVGATRLIPVILRPANWEALPLGQYSLLPPNGTPISFWANLDTALSEVAKGIRQVVEELANLTMKPHTLNSSEISLVPCSIPTQCLFYRSGNYSRHHFLFLRLSLKPRDLCLGVKWHRWHR